MADASIVPGFYRGSVEALTQSYNDLGSWYSFREALASGTACLPHGQEAFKTGEVL